MLEPLSEPPANFDLALPIAAYGPAGWFRVHSIEYGAVHFDRRPTYRFNAPDGAFGVIYVSEAPAGAFAETFLRSRRRPLRVTENALQARAMSRLEWRALRVADLTSPRLASLGLDTRIHDGDCYELAQRWSAWIHAHPEAVDGICYFARQAPGVRSVALFERVGPPQSLHVVLPSFMPTPGLLAPLAGELIAAFDVGIL